jgi:NTE family protein
MKIGYSLSGGSARGIAHLGIIKVLEENNIFPDIIAGTSAGAIVGAFYATGYRSEEILKIIVEARLLRILRPAFTLNGLLTLEKAYEFFLKYFPEDSMESLKIPLFITAVNLKTAKITFFSKGKLIQAFIASSAIPVLFNPVEINGELYIDGGILDNLPVEPLVGHCDKIIGFHCNPVDENYNQSNMRNLLERTFILTINMNIASRKPLCDIFLEPPELKKTGAFDFADAKTIYRIGYDYGNTELPKIISALEKAG